MPGLRLLADDLTGALDSAAAFAPCFGKVRVCWGHGAPGEQAKAAMAFDSGTRESSGDVAAARLKAMAPLLASGNADAIRFFKVDSLLRGHAGAELAALLSIATFDHVVIAPAIPFQGRVTRGWRQMVRDAGGWRATGEDIAATLDAAGRTVTNCRPGDPPAGGITLWDAETDADLDQIVASARNGSNVLWVGAAGLAAALARRHTIRAASAKLPPAPLLGFIGTDHAAMAGQLARCAAHHIAICANPDTASAAVTAHLTRNPAAFITCDMPQGLARRDVETVIAGRFAALATRLPRPGGLFVSGGETLRHLCENLGATGVDCTGQFEPGAPISTIVGGLWDNTPLISKSGAFGTPDFLTRLVAAIATPAEAQT